MVGDDATVAYLDIDDEDWTASYELNRRQLRILRTQASEVLGIWT